jgi:hypothetical protein
MLLSERARRSHVVARSSDIEHNAQPEQTQSTEQTKQQSDYSEQLLRLPIESVTSLDRPNGRSSNASARTTLTIDGQKNVQVDVSFIFRSPEGIIRFLGRYLEESEANAELVYAVDMKRTPLFSVDKNGAPLWSQKAKDRSKSLVTARLIDNTYSVPDDANKQENMQILGLVEEIINLQKSSADRPATVPVHVLP